MLCDSDPASSPELVLHSPQHHYVESTLPVQCDGAFTFRLGVRGAHGGEQLLQRALVSTLVPPHESPTNAREAIVKSFGRHFRQSSHLLEESRGEGASRYL